jgi:hypothetical protein
MGPSDYAELKCQLGRNKLHSGFREDLQRACCFCLENSTNLFYIRGPPDPYQCEDRSKFSQRSLSEFFALWYACHSEDCELPFWQPITGKATSFTTKISPLGEKIGGGGWNFNCFVFEFVLQMIFQHR